MKEIKLSNGMMALVDDEDYPLLSRHTWHWKTSEGIGMGYAFAHIGKTRVLMHRLVLGTAIRGFQADHANRNTLDNRRENLRWATASQNSANRRGAIGKASKYRGVYRSGRKWVARVCHNGKSFRIGLFACEEEAAKAYDVAARSIHGEYAFQNLTTEV